VCGEVLIAFIACRCLYGIYMTDMMMECRSVLQLTSA
jgi:hypothetical protein